jgi:hypothetical protein
MIIHLAERDLIPGLVLTQVGGSWQPSFFLQVLPQPLYSRAGGCGTIGPQLRSTDGPGAVAFSSGDLAQA